MSGPSTAAGANSASRFVSGGTIDKPIERDDEWLQAQIEIDERSRARAEKATTMMTSGRTLFEQLQENKNKKLLGMCGCTMGGRQDALVVTEAHR